MAALKRADHRGAAAVTIAQAAEELGFSPGTVRRWLAEGAPCVRPGHSGRNGAALVEVAALRAWREHEGSAAPRQALEELAERFREFYRAEGHRSIGLRDDAARLYLAALYEHVAIRSGEECWADEHALFGNCSGK